MRIDDSGGLRQMEMGRVEVGLEVGLEQTRKIGNSEVVDKVYVGNDLIM